MPESFGEQFNLIPKKAEEAPITPDLNTNENALERKRSQEIWYEQLFDFSEKLCENQSQELKNALRAIRGTVYDAPKFDKEVRGKWREDSEKAIDKESLTVHDYQAAQLGMLFVEAAFYCEFDQGNDYYETLQLITEFKFSAASEGFDPEAIRLKVFDLMEAFDKSEKADE